MKSSSIEKNNHLCILLILLLNWISSRQTKENDPEEAAKSELFEFDANVIAEQKRLMVGDLWQLSLRRGSPSKGITKIETSKACVQQNNKSNKKIYLTTREEPFRSRTR